MRVRSCLFIIFICCTFLSCTQEPTHAQLYDFVREYLDVSSSELAKYAVEGLPGYRAETDEMKKYYKNGDVEVLPHSGKRGIFFIMGNDPKNVKVERSDSYKAGDDTITYFVKLKIKRIGFVEDGFIKEYTKESMESLGHKKFNKEWDQSFWVEYDTKMQRVCIVGDNLLHDIYIFEKHKGILKERLGLQE